MSPGALQVTTTAPFTATGQVGGPFAPLNQSYTLTNVGGSAIGWTATKGQTWVSLSATTGTLEPGASTTVTVSLNQIANFTLAAGTHTDTVAFTAPATASGDTTRQVIVVVNQTPGSLLVSPNTGVNLSGPFNGPFASSTTFTLTNAGGASVAWTAGTQVAPTG